MADGRNPPQVPQYSKRNGSPFNVHLADRLPEAAAPTKTAVEAESALWIFAKFEYHETFPKNFLPLRLPQ